MGGDEELATDGGDLKGVATDGGSGRERIDVRFWRDFWVSQSGGSARALDVGIFLFFKKKKHERVRGLANFWLLAVVCLARDTKLLDSIF